MSTSPYPPIPEKKLTRWRRSPGVYVNVEFGVSTSDNPKGNRSSLRFAPRVIRQRVRANTHLGDTPIPFISTPGPLETNQQPPYRESPPQQQEKPRGLVIKTEWPEREEFAPPAMNDRSNPISPVSPLSPVSRFSPVSPLSPVISPIQHRIWNAPQQTPPARLDQPLSSTPGRFRLGADDLPWTTPSSYWNAEPDTSERFSPARMSPARMSPVRISPARISPEPHYSPPTSRRNEDPQRVRALSELQEALMTVDSMSHDVWEPWMWDSVGDTPRGPRSIGWAVSSVDASVSPVSLASPSLPSLPSSPSPPSPSSPLPPPYVVSQWEYSSRRRVAAERPWSTA